jgi:hypothetical protein
MRLSNRLCNGLLLAVAVSALAGCGQSSNAGATQTSAPTPPVAPAAIEGVATPSSVAVVTATNAN